MNASAKRSSSNCPQSEMNWNQMTQRSCPCAMNASTRGFAANLLDSLLIITLLVPSLILVLSVVLLISLIIL